jgi:hypothetical protein
MKLHLRIVFIAAAVLLQGCAAFEIEDRFPEPPVSPLWQKANVLP